MAVIATNGIPPPMEATSRHSAVRRTESYVHGVLKDTAYYQLVTFDNLNIQYRRGPVTEKEHYYPFGLTMAGVSDRALQFGKINHYKYNKASELEEGNFSDGSGLEWYDTRLRGLDPQLGRWWQVDPKPVESESPYVAMENNPILRNDPLGDTAGSPAGSALSSSIKGTKLGLNQRFQAEPKRGATVTGIRDTEAGRVNATTGKPVGDAVIRVDGPHSGAPTPHLNFNPKATGVPDPHTPISPTALDALGKAGEAVDGFNKIALPVAVVIDATRVAISIHDDIQQGTPGTNTIRTSSQVVGGWTGAMAGASGGAEIGAGIGGLFTPVGMAVGGVAGGVLGGIGGAIFGSKVGGSVGDKITDGKN